jgi:hypothetical protein
LVFGLCSGEPLREKLIVLEEDGCLIDDCLVLGVVWAEVAVDGNAGRELAGRLVLLLVPGDEEVVLLDLDAVVFQFGQIFADL